MTIREEIAAEMAKLEQMRRRKGVITWQMVEEAMPMHLRREASMVNYLAMAIALNRAIQEDDADATPPHGLPTGPDFRQRQAGDP